MSSSATDIKHEDRAFEERQIAFERVPVTTAPAAAPITPGNPATLGAYSVAATKMGANRQVSSLLLPRPSMSDYLSSALAAFQP